MENRFLSHEEVDKWGVEFDSSPMNRCAQNAVCKNSIDAIVVNRKRVVEDQDFNFSLTLDQSWSVTNQRSSGRCWLFAGLNLLRVPVMTHLGLKDFEFSQAYLFFYSKLERSNSFLNYIIDLIDKPIDDRRLSHLLEAPIDDGGQFDMFTSLVLKYGLVPKSIMPETYSCEHASVMNPRLRDVLRDTARIMRKQYSENVETMEKEKLMEMLYRTKAEGMRKIHKILCIHLGTPPTKFDWQYVEIPVATKKKDKRSEKKKGESKKSKSKSKKGEKKEKKEEKKEETKIEEKTEEVKEGEKKEEEIKVEEKKEEEVKEEEKKEEKKEEETSEKTEEVKEEEKVEEKNEEEKKTEEKKEETKVEEKKEEEIKVEEKKEREEINVEEKKEEISEKTEEEKKTEEKKEEETSEKNEEEEEDEDSDDDDDDAESDSDNENESSDDEEEDSDDDDDNESTKDPKEKEVDIQLQENSKKLKSMNKKYAKRIKCPGSKSKKIEDKVIRKFRGITPLQFYEFVVGLRKTVPSPQDFVSLIHDPRKTSEPLKTYTVDFIDVVAEAEHTKYLNVDSIELLKDISIKMLKLGLPVWFGACSSKGREKTEGVFDSEIFDYESLYGFKPLSDGMDKESRLLYHDSAMSHAMVIIGVDLDDVTGKPLKWKVENSWGPASGRKGNYLMTDRWFDENVYEIAAFKGVMDKKLLDAFEQPPVTLPPWDPMGTLAFPLEIGNGESISDDI